MNLKWCVHLLTILLAIFVFGTRFIKIQNMLKNNSAQICLLFLFGLFIFSKQSKKNLYSSSSTANPTMLSVNDILNIIFSMQWFTSVISVFKLKADKMMAKCLSVSDTLLACSQCNFSICWINIVYKCFVMKNPACSTKPFAAFLPKTPVNNKP